MVHKKSLVLTKEDKINYEKGFQSGFEGKDMGYFKGSFYERGWNDGRLHRDVKIIDEVKSLRNKMYKKHKRLS
jgi:hypothetical protein